MTGGRTVGVSAANQSNMQSCTFLPKCFCPFGMPRSSNSVQATPLRIGNQYTETGNSGFKQLLCQQCLNKHAFSPHAECQPPFGTNHCFPHIQPFQTLNFLLFRYGRGGVGYQRDPAFCFSDIACTSRALVSAVGRLLVM